VIILSEVIRTTFISGGLTLLGILISSYFNSKSAEVQSNPQTIYIDGVTDILERYEAENEKLKKRVDELEEELEKMKKGIAK
jgi:cell division protein FtsB